MKKYLCLLLALLTAVSMAACTPGPEEATPSEPVSEPMETTAEATTEAAETMAPTEPPYAFDAEASLAQEGTSVTFRKAAEYETALHELGFSEFRGDFWRPFEQIGPVFMPSSLTYNEEAFRLDFDYVDSVGDATQLMNMDHRVVSWVLYGTKNAPNITDISPFRPEAYDYADATDFSDLMGGDSVFDFSFVQIVEYLFSSFQGDQPTAMAVSSAHYYRDTGNLYSLAYEYEDPADIVDVPRVLAESPEWLEGKGHSYKGKFDLNAGFREFLEGMGISYQEGVQYDEFAMQLGDIHIGYIYQVGMTLTEWAESDFDTYQEWTAFESAVDGTPMVAKFGDVEDVVYYYLEDTDRDIRDIAAEHGGTIAASRGLSADLPPEKTGGMTLIWGEGPDREEELCLFKIGTTLAQWCTSKYNTAGWLLMDENTICSADGKYIVENAGLDILEIGTPLENTTSYGAKIQIKAVSSSP